MTPSLIRALAVLLIYLGEHHHAVRLLVAAYAMEQYANRYGYVGQGRHWAVSR